MRIKHGDTTREVKEISEEVLAAVELANPLNQSIVGIRLKSDETAEEPFLEYLCLPHKDLSGIKDLVERLGTPLTLADAKSEAAYCIGCMTALFIWPDGPEWSVLLERLCHGDYESVEIYTSVVKSGAFHDLFDCKRLLPDAREPETLGGWDYSAKHVADDRRLRWPNAVWVSETTFNAEVEKRQAQ